jgi:hypothetical protein
VDTSLALAVLSAILKENNAAFATVLEWLQPVTPDDVMRVVSSMLEAVSTVGTLAAMQATVIDLGQSPRILVHPLRPTVDLSVTV